jgi:glycosyltransferase involved in cell wall biosynthesis
MYVVINFKINEFKKAMKQNQLISTKQTHEFEKMEESTLTIVTATFNSEKYIESCIKSLIRAYQHTSDFPISHIVIDAYSTDKTCDLIQLLSPSSLIFKREKNGIYDALNYAISLIKSNYIMYLHSDDMLHHDFLLNMIDAINGSNSLELSIFYGSVDFIDSISNVVFTRKPPIYNTVIQKHQNIIFHPNAIYSTKLEKKFHYKLNIGLTADFDHLSEIASISTLVRVKQARYQFRISEKSSTIKNISNQEENTATADSFYNRIMRTIARIYIHLFEDRIFQRFWLRIYKQKSIWKNY